jgi:aldehyde:ferredoxin oxidoreductase
VEPKYGGPEYETIGALGSLCGVGDIKAVAKANQLCQKYGIDTISTGVSVAFAMECFERGILGKADTGGIELRFGNAEGLMAMVEMIGRREGLGELLGEGVRRAAKSIGNGSESFAVHVKGQELAVQDPRGKFGMALGYATSPTGADHIQSVYDNLYTQDSPLMDLPRTFGILDPLPYTDLGPAKVRMFVYLVNWTHFKNCAVLCVFLPYNPSQVVELVAGATGWNTSLWELVKVGERALSLGRVFNAREGFTAADDVLPDRIRQAFPSGPLQGVEIPRQAVDEALQTYYAMMNWDPVKAAPTAGKLHELDLSWAIS